MALRQPLTLLVALPLAAAVAGPLCAQTAPREDAAFTVAKYPIEATARNAVAAKEKAMADGQRAAFGSLLKRLVPVTAYRRLSTLRSVQAGNLIAGVAVKSERNSSTQYIATLDYSFNPRAVRDLLRNEGIPFVDEQSPRVRIVPVYLAPVGGAGSLPAQFGSAQGSRTWQSVWQGLDLEHALSPVRLDVPKASVPEQTVSAARRSPDAVSALGGAGRDQPVLLAIAEPDLGAGRLIVTLSGYDAVGGFVLRRSYRFEPADFAYTAELAAVVALGTLEGRWKMARADAAPGGEAALAAALEPVQLRVEFTNIREWQEIRVRIAEMPGVESFSVDGLSVRSADVTLSYPGGGERLAAALAASGIRLQNSGGTWLVQSAQ